MQDVVQSRPIPFHIGGVSASSNTELSQLGGCTARIVPLARRKIVPSEDEIVVSVFRRYRRKEISIAPLYLVPWEPVVSGPVLIVGGQMRGMIGVVKAKDGDRWLVTLIVDNISRDEIFGEKDLAGLDSNTS